ncbi:hypothetical protein Tcan_11159 [Toxocara canis]|uniref:Uncharacterized protein n=1 Tax=Toxocara canis TaxID=6265 RepID=A0A0B2V6K4_TOXCA|nr:hypothetical protein Tcan_11159 [Toxocara canis]
MAQFNYTEVLPFAFRKLFEQQLTVLKATGRMPSASGPLSRLLCACYQPKHNTTDAATASEGKLALEEDYEEEEYGKPVHLDTRPERSSVVQAHPPLASSESSIAEPTHRSFSKLVNLNMWDLRQEGVSEEGV